MKSTKLILFLVITLITLTLISCNKEKETSITIDTARDSSKVKNTEEIVNQKSAEMNIHGVDLYDRNDLTDAFISVSDIYTDSLSIPGDIMKNQKQMSFEKLNYLELDGPYRKKMLTALHLKENDTLYLFNYESAAVQKTPINKVKSVAYLSYYVSEGEDVDESSYMLGFQVESQDKNKEEFYKKYDNSIAYFGSENPFVENQLVRAEWKKIKSTNYTNELYKKSTLKKGNLYEFKNGNLTYYLQEFNSEKYTTLHQLIVVDDRGKTFFENSYHINDEGSSFNSLSGTETEGINSQWTGKLFKNKPPVIFGFIYESFGCSSITFMDKTTSEITINCDNRH